MTTLSQLQWKKYPVLNDGFITLVDVMGDDSAIVQAARVSYGKDNQVPMLIRCKDCNKDWGHSYCGTCKGEGTVRNPEWIEQPKKDRQLIRYMLSHSHSTPFEMVEFKFLVRVPMDCWRQWVRHRTASINEYSTRYTEAIDSQQTTEPNEWRLQSTNNKQGSSGYLDNELVGSLITVEEAEDLIQFHDDFYSFSKAGVILSREESLFHKAARKLYDLRLKFGIAKEQARKDLPLSTYTELYWKCDLHNIFGFLRQRMDSHAQLEIRSYANVMAEIVKQIVPVAWEAFEDYVLYAKRFSRMEMEIIRTLIGPHRDGTCVVSGHEDVTGITTLSKPSSMTDREWKEFLAKLQ